MNIYFQALKTESDLVVCLDSDKKPMTLKQVFQSMNLTAYDLTVDMLDVHAVSQNLYVVVVSIAKLGKGARGFFPFDALEVVQDGRV